MEVEVRVEVEVEVVRRGILDQDHEVEVIVLAAVVAVDQHIRTEVDLIAVVLLSLDHEVDPLTRDVQAVTTLDLIVQVIQVVEVVAREVTAPILDRDRIKPKIILILCKTFKI